MKDLREALTRAKRWLFPDAVESLGVAVTSRCNSRCVMCDFGGTRGGRHMSRGRFEAVLSTLSRLHVRSLYLTGGEPFLHPDLPDLARAVRGRLALLRLGFSTNGMLSRRICETVESLASEGEVQVTVSIDGLESHDRIRGRRGAFGRAAATVHRLAAMDGVSLDIQYTLGPWNTEDLAATMAWAHDRGVLCRVKVVEDLVAYNTFRSRGMGGTRFLLTSRDRLRMAAALAEASETYRGWGEDSLSEYALLVSRSLPERRHRFRSCPVPRHYRFVTVEGRVFGCRRWPVLARIGADGVTAEAFAGEVAGLSEADRDRLCGECYSPLAWSRR